MKPAGWRFVPDALLAGGLALALAGCLVIPLDHPTSSSRRNVSEMTVGKLRPGVTTKEEIALNLGEPDRVSEDGRCWGYTWSRVKFIWIIAGGAPAAGGGAIGGAVARDGLLQLAFDENNRLLTAMVSSEWNVADPAGGRRDAAAPAPRAEPRKQDFTIAPPPRIRGQVSSPPPAHPLTVAVLPPLDQRADPGRIGERYALVPSVGYLHFSRPVTEFLREELIGEIQLMGHRVSGAQPDVTVTPRLTRFWLTTRSSLLSFEIVAEVEVDLVYAPVQASGQTVTRHYAGRKSVRTHFPPKPAHFGPVLNGSLDDLMARIRSDDVWESWSKQDPDSAEPVKPQPPDPG